MKSYDYGFYYNSIYSAELTNLILAENQVGLFPMVYGNNPLDHTCVDTYITLTDSYIIGEMPGADCSVETPASGPYLDLTGVCRVGKMHSKAQIGMYLAQITGGSNAAPEKPCAGIMSYNPLCGSMTVTG